MEIKTLLTTFICEELLSGDTVESDESLLAEGVVDSLGMMRLVAYIEESFEFQVPPEHFTIENFRTIDAIDAYLARALNGQA